MPRQCEFRVDRKTSVLFTLIGLILVGCCPVMGQTDGPKIMEIKGLFDISIDPASPPVFSPDGKSLAQPRIGGGVDLWDLPTRTVQTLVSKRGDKKIQAIDAVFSHDNQLLAVDYSDHITTIWNVAERKEIAHLPIPLDCRSSRMEFTRDNRTFVTILTRSEIERSEDPSTPWKSALIPWDVESGKRGELHIIEANLRVVELSRDAKYLVLGKASPIIVFDVLKRCVANEIATSGNYSLSADGTLLVSVAYKGDWIEIWQLPSGKRLHRFDTDPPLGEYVAHAISPDAKLLAISRGWDVHVIDLGSGKLLTTFRCCPEGELCNYLRFSPDGQILVTNTDTINFEGQKVPSRLRFWKVPDSW